jgi:ribonuclease HI
MSVGYILYRSRSGEETLLDTGTRVLNTDEDDRRIHWTSGRGEYFGAIVAARAALDYTSEPIIVHLDNTGVVKAIKQRTWNHESYFPHALFSFLERFKDYHVRVVHREQNEKAHEQARVGLRVGREILEGTL